MTKLTAIQTPTAQSLDMASDDRDGRPLPNTLRMSGIGHECDRKLWLEYRWAAKPQKPKGRIRRTFDHGNDSERRIVRYLKEAGFDVQEIDPQTGRQWQVKLADGALVGHADGIITGIPEAPKTPHLLEIKTMNDKRFQTFKSKGMAVSDPHYVVQANGYADAMGLTRILFVVENKNDSEIHTERLKADPVSAANVAARASRIARSNVAPQGISSDPDFYVCKMCAMRDACHFRVPIERNCRTCVAVQKLDVWRCQRTNFPLDYDAQVNGCERHLYDPQFVDGEQIDYDETGNSITYKKDGSIWLDNGDYKQSTILIK